MPMFDSFEPDGGQSNFFAPMAPQQDQPAPPAIQPAPDINKMETDLGRELSQPNPDMSSVNRMHDQIMGAHRQQGEGGLDRSIDAPEPEPNSPEWWKQKNPNMDPRFYTEGGTPEMKGAVAVDAQGRLVSSGADPNVQKWVGDLNQQKSGISPDALGYSGKTMNAMFGGTPLGPGAGIDPRHPENRHGLMRPHGAVGQGEFVKHEREMEPYRRDVQKTLNAPLPTPPRAPNFAEWRQQNNHAAMQGAGPFFVMAAGALMIMAGAFGRHGHGMSIPALQGLAGFVNGVSNGNKRAAAKGLADYKQGVADIQKAYEDSRQEYHDILQNQQISIERKIEALKIAASKYNDRQTYMAADQKRLAGLDRLDLQRRKQIDQLKKTEQEAEERHKKIAFDEELKTEKESRYAAKDADKEYDSSMRGQGAAEKQLRAAELSGDAKAIERAQKLFDESKDRASRAKAAVDAATNKMKSSHTAPANQADLLDKARKAIAAGKDPEGVRKVLQDSGVDPSQLDQPAESYTTGGQF